MKHNLKKLKLLFVMLFAVFYSCEKDLYENGLQSEPNKISVKRISFKDLDSKTILKINEKIDHVNKICIKENKNKITNRFVYDSNYGFYIDRDNGKLVNNNGEISYTFPMYRESEENLENIIFKPLDSGELDAYIAKYNLKPEEFVELTLDEQENLEPTLQRVYFGQFEYICVDYLSYEDTGELVGADSEPFYDSVIVASFCSWTESGGGSSTGNNNGGSTGGSTGDTGGNYTGSSGGTGTGGVSTSPVTLTPKQLRDKCLKKNYLTSPQEQWLIDNPEIETSIIQYLESTVEDEFQGCYDEELITNMGNLINELINNSTNNVNPFPSNTLLLFPLTDQVNNVNDFLKCFNLNQSATFTIYVDQPIVNSNSTHDGDEVGHTFISIRQGTIRRVLGFWPSDSVTPGLDNTSPGTLNNDGGHIYDVALSFDITPIKLQNLINYIKVRSNYEYN